MLSFLHLASWWAQFFLLVAPVSMLQTMYNYSLHGGWALWLPYLVSGLMIGAVWCQALYYERCWRGRKPAIQEGLLGGEEGSAAGDGGREGARKSEADG